MKIVYKKYDEEYKRLACHLSIDPLADGGGQQVLSPYHAMGCNPAMMIDPLGLQGQTGMSSPNGNNHFVAPLGFMVEGTYVYLSADRLGTGKSIGMKRLEAYIYYSMMEMAEAKQQKIIAVRFAAVLDMINGYNASLQSLVSSYDIHGMIGSQMRPGYLDGGKKSGPEIIEITYKKVENKAISDKSENYLYTVSGLEILLGVKNSGNFTEYQWLQTVSTNSPKDGIKSPYLDEYAPGSFFYSSPSELKLIQNQISQQGLKLDFVFEDFAMRDVSFGRV